MERKLAFLMGMIVLSFLIVEAGGWIFAGLPGYTQVEVENTLVLTDGAHDVLMFGSMPYIVRTGEVVSGCYRLTEPSQLGKPGTADLVWPVCRPREK